MKKNAVVERKTEFEQYKHLYPKQEGHYLQLLSQQFQLSGNSCTQTGKVEVIIPHQIVDDLLCYNPFLYLGQEREGSI